MKVKQRMWHQGKIDDRTSAAQPMSVYSSAQLEEAHQARSFQHSAGKVEVNAGFNTRRCHQCPVLVTALAQSRANPVVGLRSVLRRQGCGHMLDGTLSPRVH